MKRVQPVSRVFQIFREKKKVVAIAGLSLAVVATAVSFWSKGRNSHEHHSETHVATEPSAKENTVSSDSQSVFAEVLHVFERLQNQVEEIRRLDLDNQKLRLENAQLRLRMESSSFECSVAKSQKITEEYAILSKSTAGSRTGRTLASISYQPPTHLLPGQLYALGVSQYQAGEFEKAAKIFTLLAEMSKEEAYQTLTHKLLTGSAWYRLKNWDMADQYFSQVTQLASQISGEPEDSQLKIFAQARLWKALLAHQRG
ncbi:MAG: hypothetical protein KGQ59_11235, partial [Bdellovibrionales bacterium]|nr:hypothetical protein [Bdellovibrionales bacterium]